MSPPLGRDIGPGVFRAPSAGAGMRVLLEALAGPSVVLETPGRVVLANKAALTRFGRGLPGQDLASLVPEAEAPPLRAWLVRCSGTHAALPGAATLRGVDGTAMRLRCSGALVVPAQDATPALLLLRFSETGTLRFSTLAAKVRELHAEIRARRRAQAVLEEAIQARELMMRELHHRVKNNIQMLAGMVFAARREAASEDARAVLDDAARRLAAIGAVHQMLYRTDALESLDGDAFVANLSASILGGLGARARLAVAASAAAPVPNDAAVPLALILNELLVNAVKHGGPRGAIRVRFARADAGFALQVEDDGPGFDPAEPTRRSSGLGLVRGLTRQLGGSFTVARGGNGGACCVVQVPDGGQGAQP